MQVPVTIEVTLDELGLPEEFIYQNVLHDRSFHTFQTPGNIVKRYVVTAAGDGNLSLP